MASTPVGLLLPFVRLAGGGDPDQKILLAVAVADDQGSERDLNPRRMNQSSASE
jgi:hypothetical protein